MSYFAANSARALAALVTFVLFVTAPIAHAGMRLTLLMLAPEDVPRLVRDGRALANAVFEATAPFGMQMDKEWHGLHFLLTGDAWSTRGPYGQVILGGKNIGPDLGYGPARVLTAAQVKEIASKLRALSEDELKRRYDPEKMTEAQIYPEIIWKREGQAALLWLLEGYRQLLAFCVRAAAEGNAVLLAIV